MGAGPAATAAHPTRHEQKATCATRKTQPTTKHSDVAPAPLANQAGDAQVKAEAYLVVTTCRTTMTTAVSVSEREVDTEQTPIGV